MKLSLEELKCINRLLKQDLNEVSYEYLHNGGNEELAKYKSFLLQLQDKIEKEVKQ